MNEQIASKVALRAIRNEMNEADAAVFVEQYRAYLSAKTDAERELTYTRVASVMFDLMAEVMPNIETA